MGVIEECQQAARRCVTGTNFDPKCALSGSWAHHILRNDLLHEIGLTESIEARSGEDDRVILTFREFAQPGIDVAPQGMNLEIRPQSLQLGLAAQAAGSHPCALRKT